MKYADIKTVIDEGYCVGCGVCGVTSNNKITIVDEEQYRAKIVKPMSDNELSDSNKVCPFSKDSIDRDIASPPRSKFVGNYEKAYALKVLEGEYRAKGSSGGFGSWILTELLKQNKIDAVIHVKEGDSGHLFEYSVSNTKNEIAAGASSKYYPVSLNQMLDVILDSDKRFALIGVPCFVRAVRNLIELNEVKNIKFLGSLYCGHLKNRNYSNFLARDISSKTHIPTSINFRKKIGNGPSSQYETEVIVNDKVYSKRNSTIFGTNWGLGLFKYKGCDFCEDVSGELADFSLGDAWLPEYESDSDGTNVVVLRNKEVLEIVESAKNKGRVWAEELTEDKLFECQAGGYRHKLDGIHVRNKLYQFMGKTPIKPRYQLINKVSALGQLSYFLRVSSRKLSSYYSFATRNYLYFFCFKLVLMLNSKAISLINRIK